MMEIISVGIGGFIGSCTRFLFNKASARFMLFFPFGTLLSNVIAGLCIGFVVGLEESSFRFTPRTRLFLTTGLLGGLSTFSTFSIETIALFQSEKYLLAMANIILNLGLSLLGVVLGMAFAKLLFRKS